MATTAVRQMHEELLTSLIQLMTSPRSRCMNGKTTKKNYEMFQKWFSFIVSTPEKNQLIHFISLFVSSQNVLSQCNGIFNGQLLKLFNVLYNNEPFCFLFTKSGDVILVRSKYRGHHLRFKCWC